MEPTNSAVTYDVDLGEWKARPFSHWAGVGRAHWSASSIHACIHSLVLELFLPELFLPELLPDTCKWLPGCFGFRLGP